MASALRLRRRQPAWRAQCFLLGALCLMCTSQTALGRWEWSRGGSRRLQVSSSPTPSASSSPSASNSPTPSVSATPTPSPSVTPSPTTTPSATPTPLHCPAVLAPPGVPSAAEEALRWACSGRGACSRAEAGAAAAGDFSATAHGCACNAATGGVACDRCERGASRALVCGACDRAGTLSAWGLDPAALEDGSRLRCVRPGDSVCAPMLGSTPLGAGQGQGVSLLPAADGGAVVQALQARNAFEVPVLRAADAGGAELVQGCPGGYVPCDSRNASSPALAVPVCVAGGWLETVAMGSGSVAWPDSVTYPSSSSGDPDTQTAAGFATLAGDTAGVRLAGGTSAIVGSSAATGCSGVGWTGRFSETGTCSCPVGYGGAACDVATAGEAATAAASGEALWLRAGNKCTSDEGASRGGSCGGHGLCVPTGASVGVTSAGVTRFNVTLGSTCVCRPGFGGAGCNRILDSLLAGSATDGASAQWDNTPSAAASGGGGDDDDDDEGEATDEGPPIGEGSGSSVLAWRPSAWSACSAECGGGSQARVAVCVATSYDALHGGTVDTVQVLNASAQLAGEQVAAMGLTQEQLLRALSGAGALEVQADSELLLGSLGLRNLSAVTSNDLHSPRVRVVQRLGCNPFARPALRRACNSQKCIADDASLRFRVVVRSDPWVVLSSDATQRAFEQLLAAEMAAVSHAGASRFAVQGAWPDGAAGQRGLQTLVTLRARTAEEAAAGEPTAGRALWHLEAAVSACAVGRNCTALRRAGVGWAWRGNATTAAEAASRSAEEAVATAAAAASAGGTSVTDPVVGDSFDPVARRRALLAGLGSSGSAAMVGTGALLRSVVPPSIDVAAAATCPVTGGSLRDTLADGSAAGVAETASARLDEGLILRGSAAYLAAPEVRLVGDILLDGVGGRSVFFGVSQDDPIPADGGPSEGTFDQALLLLLIIAGCVVIGSVLLGCGLFQLWWCSIAGKRVTTREARRITTRPEERVTLVGGKMAKTSKKHTSAAVGAGDSEPAAGFGDEPGGGGGGGDAGAREDGVRFAETTAGVRSEPERPVTHLFGGHSRDRDDASHDGAGDAGFDRVSVRVPVTEASRKEAEEVRAAEDILGSIMAETGSAH